jgi:hypothetical protein
MKEISTDIVIQASPAKVWSILADFTNYPTWNPFIREVDGEAKEGSKLRINLQIDENNSMTFKPKVMIVTPGKELRWLGNMIFKGLLDGEHIFELTDLGNGQTRLVQREQFSGLLLPLLWRSLQKDTRAGFVRMNESLKAFAQA